MADSRLRQLVEKGNEDCLYIHCVGSVSNLWALIMDAGTGFFSQDFLWLSPEEKESISQLNPEITNLKEQRITCRTNRIKTELKKTELEMNLSTNLVKRKEELEKVKLSTETDSLLEEAKVTCQELTKVQLLVDQLTQELHDVSESIQEMNMELGKIKVQKDDVKTSKVKDQSRLQDEAKELKKLLSKKNMYITKQEEYSKKMGSWVFFHPMPLKRNLLIQNFTIPMYKCILDIIVHFISLSLCYTNNFSIFFV